MFSCQQFGEARLYSAGKPQFGTACTFSSTDSLRNTESPAQVEMPSLAGDESATA